MKAGYALLAVLAACDPQLAAQSAAPPGRIARFDEVPGFWQPKAYTLELSQGVALAFHCTQGGPCTHLRVTSDDPAIAEPRAAASMRLEPNHAGAVYGGAPQPWQNQTNEAAAVVIGKAPGKTKLRVHAEEGDRVIEVTIVPPPAT